jgi:hypothetical protein
VTPLAKRAHPHSSVMNMGMPALLKPKQHRPFQVMRFILFFNEHWSRGWHVNRQQQRWRPRPWAKRWCHEVQLILSCHCQRLNWRWHHPRVLLRCRCQVEVPLEPGAAEVPIPAEVEVPLVLGAAAVSMAVAEPGGGEVLLRSTAPPSPTPPSSMLHPFLARPFPTYCIHKRRTNPT